MLKRQRIGAVIAAVAVLGGALAAEQRRSAQDVEVPVILAIEDQRAPTQADVQVLLDALRGATRGPALTALGRLQRRDVIADILPYLAIADTRAAAAGALPLALRGTAVAGAASDRQEQSVEDAMLAAGNLELVSPQPVSLGVLAHALGRLPYDNVEAFKAAETFLRRVLEKPFPMLADLPHSGAARGLESLARLHRKLASLDEETIVRLRTVARTIDSRRADQQRNALAALIASQAVDAETLTTVIGSQDPEVRRLAMLSLTGAGSVVADPEKIAPIRKALSDSSYMVRLEAVRAWARRGVKDEGCQPLLDALQDRNQHVVLAALDALGDACRDDATITTRLASVAGTPRPQGPWQREMHAYVALTKRDRERAAPGLLAFAMHETWQVRMYAARAAALVEDVAVLTRLAADPENNVAEAALVTLRRLAAADSDPAFVAVLGRRNRTVGQAVVRPYEVMRTAAIALEGATPTPALVNALAGALERVTADQCETSRDTRLALIARLATLGSSAQAATFTPLLRDFDPKVAAAAAATLANWSGRAAEIEPVPTRPAAIPSAAELSSRDRVTVEMDNGRRFELTFDSSPAPLARARFLAGARAGYYNNLTFHRVVPNFVVQGGSPGANEYCGDCPFMRDEVGGMHVRGTVGISTRGPDTGDAQIFINLVDNPRLDFDYTVFARVCSGMDVVDDIAEGDRIVRVNVVPAGSASSCGR